MNRSVMLTCPVNIMVNVAGNYDLTRSMWVAGIASTASPGYLISCVLIFDFRSHGLGRLKNTAQQNV